MNREEYNRIKQVALNVPRSMLSARSASGRWQEAWTIALVQLGLSLGTGR